MPVAVRSVIFREPSTAAATHYVCVRVASTLLLTYHAHWNDEHPITQLAYMGSEMRELPG